MSGPCRVRVCVRVVEFSYYRAGAASPAAPDGGCRRRVAVGDAAAAEGRHGLGQHRCPGSERGRQARLGRQGTPAKSFDSLVNTGWVKKVSCLLRDYVNK